MYDPSLVQRAVYKDIVLLLQKEKYLTAKQLKTKVSACFNSLVGFLFPSSQFIAVFLFAILQPYRGR